MLSIIRGWLDRHFSDPEAVLLLVVLTVGLLIVIGMGGILMPVLASIVIAYLLDWWVQALERKKIGHVPAVTIVFIGFLSIFSLALLVMMPLIWRQFTTLFNDLPTLLGKGKLIIIDLVEAYPAYFTEEQIDNIISSALNDMQRWGKFVLAASLTSIPGVIAWIVYLILVPLLVFFFLKDRDQITDWVGGFFPRKNKMLNRVWNEVNGQIGNYVRGKITEIFIVWFATYLVFIYFDLRYSMLLSALVGLSVVIPYVGAAVVTIPVIFVAYLQFGWSGEFAWCLTAYLVVQALDGNVLVPLLFSEAVNLHPVAIMVSILLFGGLWGFWGVFFAIPLATVIKAVINAWPKAERKRRRRLRSR